MRRNTDWLTELHHYGEWRQLADWLCRHNAYLTETMATFADGMRRKKGDPTPRQFALLISLRGGVEALQSWESLVSADERDAAMADDAEYSTHHSLARLVH